ncbi:MAG TPA: c-type cytochrome [Bauldia sp.]|nr:c-type cytochrome [Bauldia sp.]
MNRTLAASVLTVALWPLAAHADPDPAHGAKLFRMFCAGCHKIADANGGSDPDLNGVVGRPAGSMPGFQYSAAMRDRAAAGLVWTPANLDAWLTKPAVFMPGTDMSFLYGFSRQADRDDLIAYLESYSPDYRPDAPAAVPAQ